MYNPPGLKSPQSTGRFILPRARRSADGRHGTIQENLSMKQLAAFAILGLVSWNAQAQSCNPPLVETLLAHGSITAGTVSVGNDTVNLYVNFTTAGDFTMSRADVAVATSLAGIPQSGGQPSLSAFPYRQTFSPEVTTYTFAIPLASIPATASTSIVVAAHASLDSPTQGHQQAWANPGQLFPCSQACKQSGGGCDDGGDHAHLTPGDDGGGDGGGDGCHGDDHTHSRAGISWKRSGVGVFDDGHGGQGQCGGGDDHGDGTKVSPLWGSGGDDNSCGGGGDDHGDSQHLGASPQDGGGDGGGDHGGDGGGDHHHSDDGSDCQAGCGTTYFGYVVLSCGIHE
jgi:hypothetical protein